MSEHIAVSTWALHRTLGISYPDSPASGPRGRVDHAEPSLPLLELPAALAAHGYTAMQLCHFHLPDRGPAYVEAFRKSLQEAGVTLHALLVDEGDISDPENGERDRRWIESWLSTARDLGAERARVIAGKQSYSEENLQRSIAAMKVLAASTPEVRLETENWFDLLATPAAVHQLLDALDGKLSLCADWGNWPRPFKYEGLPEILPRAKTCHAKMEFLSPGTLDEDDAHACLTATRAVGFTGTYVLVNGGGGTDEWSALEVQRNRILA